MYLTQEIQKPWIKLKCIKDYYMDKLDGGELAFKKDNLYLFVFDADYKGGMYFTFDEIDKINHYLSIEELKAYFKEES